MIKDISPHSLMIILIDLCISVFCLLFDKVEALDAFNTYKVEVEKKIYHKIYEVR